MVYIPEQVVAFFITVFPLLVACASFVGYWVHNHFVNNPGPVFVVEHASALWACSMALIYAFMPLVFAYSPNFQVRIERKNTRFWQLLTGVIFFFHVIVLFVIGRAEARMEFTWLILSAINCLTALRLLRTLHNNAITRRWAGWLNDSLGVDPADRTQSRFKHICRFCTWGAICLWFFFLGLLMLFLAGSWVRAAQITRFSPYGKMLQIELPDGMAFDLHYKCIGPNASSKATIYIDQDPKQPMINIKPLVNLFADAGRRVCAIDKPGVGFSSDRYCGPDVANDNLWFPYYIAHTSNNQPILFVVADGDGSLVYNYTRNAPKNSVEGIVMINVASPGATYRVQQQLQNWTDEEANTARITYLTRKEEEYSGVRTFLVPTGFHVRYAEVSYIDANYTESSEFRAYIAAYESPRLYTTRYALYQKQLEDAQTTPISDRGVYDLNPLNATGIPIYQIIEDNTNEQAYCAIFTVTECNYAFAQAIRSELIATANVTGNAWVFQCPTAHCLHNMITSSPQTVLNIMKRAGIL